MGRYAARIAVAVIGAEMAMSAYGRKELFLRAAMDRMINTPSALKKGRRKFLRKSKKKNTFPVNKRKRVRMFRVHRHRHRR